ncbi:hypothetical protein GXW82_41640 [Streptacidiphilus sp. 4-A2]|nr:hypothetical protein [Streptacidiphilus sp. 4-A2]
MDSTRWGGLVFAVAVIGTVLYTRTARLSEMPGWRRAVPGRAGGWPWACC